MTNNKNKEFQYNEFSGEGRVDNHSSSFKSVSKLNTNNINHSMNDQGGLVSSPP